MHFSLLIPLFAWTVAAAGRGVYIGCFDKDGLDRGGHPWTLLNPNGPTCNDMCFTDNPQYTEYSSQKQVYTDNGVDTFCRCAGPVLMYDTGDVNQCLPLDKGWHHGDITVYVNDPESEMVGCYDFDPNDISILMEIDDYHDCQFACKQRRLPWFAVQFHDYKQYRQTSTQGECICFSSNRLFRGPATTCHLKAWRVYHRTVQP
ncbi:hypothetical protein IAT40_007261 [Kwoniella sp. CBS 6097]